MKKKFIDWLTEIYKYDIFVVIKFWLQGKDFLEEREKWKNSFKK